MFNKKDNTLKGWKSEIRITKTDTKRKGNKNEKDCFNTGRSDEHEHGIR